MLFRQQPARRGELGLVRDGDKIRYPEREGRKDVPRETAACPRDAIAWRRYNDVERKTGRVT